MNDLIHEEGEALVIGALCINPKAYDLISSDLNPDDFAIQKFKTIYRAIQNLDGEFEMFTLADQLEKIKPNYDWLNELASLAKNTPGSANVKTYAGKIREYARLRRLFDIGQQVSHIARDWQLSAGERFEKAEACFSEINGATDQRGLITPNYGELVKELEQRYHAKGGITGLSSGFENVDQRLGGFKPGQLVVIAARPAMGKTAIALNLAYNVASQGVGVGMFSLEMNTTELLMRGLSDQGDLDHNIVMRAAFDESHNQPDRWSCVTAGVLRMKELGVVYCDEVPMTISQLCAHARRYKRQNLNLQLLIVDHIGLVDAPGDMEAVRVGAVSRGLKVLAKQLQITVVALAQQNRKCDERADSRPVLSDLRSSGAIEQDADVVGFIYRDVVYNENTQNPELMELIWRKVRAGQIGTDYFTSQLHRSRFVETEPPGGWSIASEKKSRRRMEL